MTKIVRNRIAYWFFLVAGMAGIVKQYFIDDLNRPWYIELGLTTLFSIFIFKPLTLMSIYKDIRNVVLGVKSNSVKSEVDPGGEDPDIDDV